MLPLTDHNPRQTVPVVTMLIIIVNVLMFLWELSLGPHLQQAIGIIGFVPNDFWVKGEFGGGIRNIFISMFLHGSFLHIGANMLYFWIFGDNIEDRLGHVRFTIFYFLCGILAALTHAFANPSSTLPAIG